MTHTHLLFQIKAILKEADKPSYVRLSPSAVTNVLRKAVDAYVRTRRVKRDGYNVVQFNPWTVAVMTHVGKDETLDVIEASKVYEELLRAAGFEVTRKPGEASPEILFVRKKAQALKEGASDGKTIVVSFGRFNPPHRGHKLLTDLMVQTARQQHGDAVLYVKGRTGPKDPLNVQDKIHYLKMLTPGLTVLSDPSLPDPIDIMHHYSAKGYKHLILVLGGDRIDKLTNEIQADMKSGRLGFVDFKVLSAGDRGTGETWSATQQRDAASANDYAAFKAGLPPGFPDRDAHEMFGKVRQGLGKAA